MELISFSVIFRSKNSQVKKKCVEDDEGCCCSLPKNYKRKWRLTMSACEIIITMLLLSYASGFDGGGGVGLGQRDISLKGVR